ncbi:MAG: DUF2892 domain-containing protein [Bacteroidetes bacterium]|nr:DUF2892 domain-containing protein [Bacteroidota bacterium]
MRKNMGGADRIIRILIAVVLGYLLFNRTIELMSFWGIVAALVAVIFLLTSFIRVCPLYLPFGINTNRSSE